MVGDIRRWWVVSGDGMVNHYYEALAARSALARFRADLIESFRGGDCTKTDATLKVRALDLRVLQGPLTTEEACADETGWTWAEAISDESHATAQAPVAPSTRALAVEKLGEARTDRLEANVRRRYRRP
ncbi:hypothetical protein [Streptomyces umbrinus]|uniref:hypothetical protein n=1 Tax=Streptomyces umbrinus TaxID=67370 RepID=UPI0033E5AEFD